MNKEIATELNRLLLEAFRSVDDATRLVQERCPTREFKFFRTEAGKVAGGLTLLLFPLWEDYPDLAPEGVMVKRPKRRKR
ncbi:hypothetical protein P0D72_15575, partial [Paraburkholderia sediminicola]|uniref:hypothetical protein n=1 Tax=Paraburkholderia sediminicola TaxID=458836 RepID=UPI0038B90173